MSTRRSWLGEELDEEATAHPLQVSEGDVYVEPTDRDLSAFASTRRFNASLPMSATSPFSADTTPRRLTQASSPSMGRPAPLSPSPQPTGGMKSPEKTPAQERRPASAASIARASTTTTASASPQSPEMLVTDVDVRLEFGDEYHGDGKRRGRTTLPHGTGTLRSTGGQHCYVGEFKDAQRDGEGKLVTQRFALSCTWKANRPDFSTEVRIDIPTGDKYVGYLALVQPSKKEKQSLIEGISGFSNWVASVSLVRTLWGELVSADGTRHYGQWQNDEAHGFGLHVSTDGTRFIGMFSHNARHGRGALWTPRGLLYDGEFRGNAFVGSGTVSTACGLRVSGSWTSELQLRMGQVELPVGPGPGMGAGDSAIGPLHRGWSPFFNTRSSATKKQEYAQCSKLRAAVATALKGKPKGECNVLKHVCHIIDEVPVFSNSVKMFRRAFYFLYGTCGANDEMAGGFANNPLGWCAVRRVFGGCVHHGKGKKIVENDISMALADIFSFVTEQQRWAFELMGSDNAREVADREDICEGVLRRLLDTVLSLVHGPLLNLYSQVYRTQEAELKSSLERLSAISLDDLGVDFARDGEGEALFVPYHDSIRALQDLTLCKSFSSKLQCLVKWSSEIDAQSRIAQIRFHEDQMERIRTSVGSTEKSQVFSFAAAVAAQGGSADDLLPIHQYVVVRANISHLYASVRLIQDLSSFEQLIDPAGREMFCVTTLSACIQLLPCLWPTLREAGIITPVSLYEKRLEDALSMLDEAELLPILEWIPVLLDELAFAANIGARSAGDVVAIHRVQHRHGTTVADRVLRNIGLRLVLTMRDDSHRPVEECDEVEDKASLHSAPLAAKLNTLHTSYIYHCLALAAIAQQ